MRTCAWDQSLNIMEESWACRDPLIMTSTCWVSEKCSKAVTACLHLMTCIYWSKLCCAAASSLNSGSVKTYASSSQTKLGNSWTKFVVQSMKNFCNDFDSLPSMTLYVPETWNRFPNLHQIDQWIFFLLWNLMPRVCCWSTHIEWHAYSFHSWFFI